MRVAYSLYIAFALSFSWAQAQSMYPESSLPAPGLPLAVDINKSFEKMIRVKVFPHDLKSDWVHGGPDNPKTALLEGDFFFNGLPARSARLRVEKDRLAVELDGARSLSVKKGMVRSNGPVAVVRERNLDKTHSYLGELEVFVENGQVTVVNHIDIETYLRGVVPKEAVSDWPIEALKAQAVAARTYAYYHLLTSNAKDYDVDDTARFQVYAGISASVENTDNAIAQTRGEILTHNSQVIVAFFHSYSGGRTDSAENIFGGRADYCQGVAEIFSREELRRELKPSSQWIVEWTTDWMSKKELLTQLKNASNSRSAFRSFSAARDFEIFEKELHEEFDSVKTLSFSQGRVQANLNFVDIRTALGWSNFPAYHFRLIKGDDDRLAFTGSGWGHHVGMSQWGAFMMAKNFGKTYSDILNHYYSNIVIETI